MDQASKAGPDREKRKLTNIKDNFEHHTAKKLAEEHSFIVVEDLKHTKYARFSPGDPGESGQERKGQGRPQPEPGIR